VQLRYSLSTLFKLFDLFIITTFDLFLSTLLMLVSLSFSQVSLIITFSTHLTQFLMLKQFIQVLLLNLSNTFFFSFQWIITHLMPHFKNLQQLCFDIMIVFTLVFFTFSMFTIIQFKRLLIVPYIYEG